MSESYAKFLAAKRAKVAPVGRDIDPDALHPRLKPFQRDIVTRAIRGGRHAIWTDTGTGKTTMQLEWLRHTVARGRSGLVLAPLAVCQQTIREGRALDLDLDYAPDGVPRPGLWITNYERAHRVDPSSLDAVVLDEGSILRDSTGKTRNLLIEHFASVDYRLTCTATPAPNQAEELTNQAEFVGAARRVDMLATYFVHDENGWRPKGHARGPMFRWMAQWASVLRTPSDLGYDDEGYDLPGLDITPEIVEVDVHADGQLFATDLGGVGGRSKVRRDTLAARVAKVVSLVDDSHRIGWASDKLAPTVSEQPRTTSNDLEPWIVWCGLNDEQDALERALGDRAISVRGNMSAEEKAEKLLAWVDSARPILITKPSIAGRGMNFQRAARMAFCGLGDSYEDYYQCIRRSHRFGQTRRVRAHVVLSELEQQIAANVARKEREAQQMMGELVAAMRAAQEVSVA